MSVQQHSLCSVSCMGCEQLQHKDGQGKQPHLGQLERFLLLPTLKYKEDSRASFILCVFICFPHEDIQHQFPSDWSQCDRIGPLPGVSLVHNLKEVFLWCDTEANHTKASWSLCSLMPTKIIVLANSLFEPFLKFLKAIPLYHNKLTLTFCL